MQYGRQSTVSRFHFFGSIKVLVLIILPPHRLFLHTKQTGLDNSTKLRRKIGLCNRCPKNFCLYPQRAGKVSGVLFCARPHIGHKKNDIMDFIYPQYRFIRKKPFYSFTRVTMISFSSAGSGAIAILFSRASHPRAA